jgi:aminopeptidase YwaD
VGRIVICAHVDAKDNTPGALDNASGVAMMIVLAELLEGYQGRYEIEFVAFNGEDHYSAQGHKEYIRANQGQFEDILLAINTDVAGYVHGESSFSLYDCPDEVESVVKACMEEYSSLKEGPPWYQSDHSIFIQQGCSAMAITSDQFMELSTKITHTPDDTTDLVDLSKLADIACALRDILIMLT